MRITFIPLVLMILAFAGCATNDQRTASPRDPFAMPIQEFMQEADKLRVGLAQGEPRELEKEELERFDEISERIRTLVGDATEIDQIPMDDRIQLFQLRSEMVKLAVGDVEPEIVCFKQHVTGTRLKGKRRCYTLAELENARMNAEYIMQYIQNHPQGTHPDS